ncbi:DNA adenine methylase [Streptobacillus moniliformis]|uniref:DNA adenine methylase n=1 Tax=Streptobacillus moniliformis TaxID=34105 RepID=UPI001D025228|nr:Dam family site-specific DNA-(adenine-N6)-methyltransferase [Streptobacillus moniliformis]
MLSEIKSRYPHDLGKIINKYCEPFIGGGAVLFDILLKYKLKEVLINDINAELINTYNQIKNNLDLLLSELSSIQEHFWKLDTEERKLYYYEKRDRFNYIKLNGDEKVSIEKATLFIFLNKTCFNGLFRVNKKGFFNVPIGSYKFPLICDEENLKNISKLLQNVTIRCGKYSDCEYFIDENTFVYIDPPYRPLTSTSKFNAYYDFDFNDDEQISLARFVDKISSKGAKFI